MQVAFFRAGKAEQLPWVGFAKVEAVAWWQKQGAVLVDVPAERFAERSMQTGQLVWSELPPGQVIRGLIDPHEGHPVLKIVTRLPSKSEFTRFDSPTVPVIEPPFAGHSAGWAPC
jgi:hypothetical protein